MGSLRMVARHHDSVCRSMREQRFAPALSSQAEQLQQGCGLCLLVARLKLGCQLLSHSEG